MCFKSKNTLRSLVILPVGIYTTSLDFQNKRNIPKRKNAVPNTINNILSVDERSVTSKVDANIRIPNSSIATEKISPETLVRFAISGCVDAKIVASIA